MVADYFSMLEDWKKLPAYKLETRIDSLVGFALPGALSSLIDFNTRAIIPELPIRVGTVYPESERTASANRSFKVDFYVRSQEGENLFVEFKSDSGSRRQEQDDYLTASMRVRMKAILEGILALSRVSPFKDKYKYLLGKLEAASLIDAKRNILIADEPIRVLYIQPRMLATDGPKEVIDFSRLAGAVRELFPDWDLMTSFASSLDRWSSG